MRKEKIDNKYILQEYNCNYITCEIPPGIFEISDHNNTLDALVKATIFNDIITMKTQVKTKSVLRFNEISFFALLRLSPN